MRKQNKPRYNQDEITPSKGLLGFIHKMVMVLLWPLRKPYIAIPLFILMYLIPTFIGARPNEVHIWYYNKIKGFFTPVSKQIVNKSKELAQNAPFEIPSLSELKDKVMPKSASDTSQTNPKLEEYNKEQEIRRKTFDKAKQAQSPYSIDIMSQPDQPNAPKFETKPKATEATTPTDVEQSPSQSEPADTSIAKAKQRKLDLIYLETPQEIIGEDSTDTLTIDELLAGIGAVDIDEVWNNQEALDFLANWMEQNGYYDIQPEFWGDVPVCEAYAILQSDGSEMFIQVQLLRGVKGMFAYSALGTGKL